MNGFIKKNVSIFLVALFCSSLLCSETYLGTKTPAEPKEVGDIVFNDGSAIPYSEELELSAEQKGAAIAVIFYIGTACSDENSTRILGIGLKTSQKYLKLCDKKASAFFEDIETNRDTTKNGSQNFEKIGEWLREHGKTDDTGEEKKYPAFYFAKNYGKNLGTLCDGWYIPSKVELQYAHEQYETIKAICKLCKIPEVQGTIWTSTQKYQENFPGTLVWNCSFYSEEDTPSSGIFNGNSKNCSWLVCVIREF